MDKQPLFHVQGLAMYFEAKAALGPHEHEEVRSVFSS